MQTWKCLVNIACQQHSNQALRPLSIEAVAGMRRGSEARARQAAHAALAALGGPQLPDAAVATAAAIVAERALAAHEQRLLTHVSGAEGCTVELFSLVAARTVDGHLDWHVLSHVMYGRATARQAEMERLCAVNDGFGCGYAG